MRGAHARTLKERIVEGEGLGLVDLLVLVVVDPPELPTKRVHFSSLEWDISEWIVGGDAGHVGQRAGIVKRDLLPGMCDIRAGDLDLRIPRRQAADDRLVDKVALDDQRADGDLDMHFIVPVVYPVRAIVVVRRIDLQPKRGAEVEYLGNWDRRAQLRGQL